MSDPRSYTWQRQVRNETVVGASHEEIALATVLDGERLERVRLDFELIVATTDSDILFAWLLAPPIVVVQWTTGSPPSTPTNIGGADLDAIDVLLAAKTRMGGVEVFNNILHVPARGDAVRLDTHVTRVPPEGFAGTVWLTWGLGGFTGAGVAVGFSRILSQCLVSAPL